MQMRKEIPVNYVPNEYADMIENYWKEKKSGHLSNTTREQVIKDWKQGRVRLFVDEDFLDRLSTTH